MEVFGVVIKCYNINNNNNNPKNKDNNNNKMLLFVEIAVYSCHMIVTSCYHLRGRYA